MELDAGSVWVMVAAAMVLMMTPGLAFFYGGMARAKSAINMIMMSFISVGIAGVMWVLWGYGLTTGPPLLGGVVGNPLHELGLTQHLGTAELISVGFGATFAIITVALISGAVADRTRFRAWVVFVPLWVTLVYCPLAFMVWGGGLLGAEGLLGSVVGEAIDFAGGLVVHVNAGLAALILVMVIGSRSGFAKGFHRAHNIPLVMIGTTMLWFGWFGFNGGAAGSVEQAGLIWVNTLTAPAAAMLAWLVTERIRDGHATSIGAASGIVSGLVAITPACASVSPLGALVIGLLAGVFSALAVGLKYRLNYDDALDVVGVHLVSGLVGTVAIGFLAIGVDGEALGLLYGGGLGLLVTQTVATLVTLAYTGIVTVLIALAIHKTIGFRVAPEDEERGVDLSEHSETAYSFIDPSYDPIADRTGS